MKYMGSKNRIAKDIIPLIMKCKKNKIYYIEPFCGGCNLIDKITGIKRIANDNNYYLIEMFKALQKGWIPPIKISEEEYKDYQNNYKNKPSYLVGYIGFNSYGGKFFGGYRRDSIGKRDYWLEHYNNIMKQIINLKDVLFFNYSYDKLYIPNNSIIYCDPPYHNTTKYKSNFNHKIFWDWVRKESYRKDNIVLVSEYNAPDDFICIWSKQINNSLEKDTGSKKGVEKLFLHDSRISEYS